MKIRNSGVTSQRGITLVEVLICMIIVAMIVGPLSMNFVTAHKQQATAQRITDATNQAEMLMGQIKDRITMDILIKQKVDSGEALSVDEQTRYDNFCKSYIVDQAGLSAKTLQAFLGIEDAEAFKADYQTDLYEYELVAWPLEKAPLATDPSNADKERVELNKSNLSNSTTIKLTSDKTSFDEDRLDASSKKVSFSLDKDSYKAFIDAKGKYLLNDGDYQVIKATLDGDGKISSSSTPGDKVKIGSTEAVTVAPGKGRIIMVEKSDPSCTEPSVLLLDVSQYMAKNPTDVYTLKFVNTTDKDLSIKIKYATDEKKLAIQKALHLVAIDTGSSKTGIDYVDCIDTEENYILGLIIREKEPLIGKAGKEIKRMVTLYSYDQTIGKRR